MKTKESIFPGWISACNMYAGIILSIIFSCGEAYSNGPGAEICGSVCCKSSGQLLEYATASLMLLPDSVNVSNEIAGSEGLFCFNDVPAGSYYIVIQYMGYTKRFIDDVVITQGSRNIDLGKIEMEPSMQDLEEFLVTEEKNAVAFEIDRKVVNVSKELAAEGGTAVDALQNAPSVQVDAYGNVLLRGSTDFTLLINGKPTLLEPSEVLQQTLAETIESIEIITNPSVKYEAEGTTGIINIKLKSQKEKMAEGIMNLSLANGEKYSGNIMLNKQFKRFRTFAGISYSNKTQRTESWGYHDVFNSLTNYTDSIDSQRKIKRVTTGIKLGADYEINDQNSLSFSAKLGKWQFSRNISSAYTWLTEGPPDSSFADDNTEAFSLVNHYLSTDISYTHLFKKKKGHKIDLGAFYGGVLNETGNDFEVEEQDYLQQIQNASNRSQWRFNADYTLPMNYNLILETGLFTDLHGSLYEYTVNENPGSTVNHGSNESFYEEFDYKSNVFASYASLSGGVDKWLDFQLGLRIEYYDYQFKDKGTGKDFTSTAINLFPSVHLSKGLGQDHRFGLSYSRRVTRPDEWQLCPFEYSSDYYETRRGNPELSQSLIDSYELNYLWSKDKFRLNTDLFHRSAHSPIGTYLLEEDGRFVMSYENLDKETNSGIEMMGMYTPVEWLQFRLSLSAYHSQWGGTLSDANQVEGSSLQGNGSFSSTFTINKNTSLQFLAIYYAPANIPQGHADAFYYFDFILKHSFFNKKLILGLRTHNTFDSGLYHYSASGSNYFSEGWYRYEGPVLIFNLTYKLNNFKPRASNPGVRMDFDSGLDL